MIAYNSNEGSRHTDVFWFLLYAADSAQALGQLAAIDYSDSTPDVAFTYDRLGRQLTITDVLGIRTNFYSPTSLLEERHLDGTALVRSYDPFGRPSGIALGPDYAVGYGYDEYGRFSTVTVSNGATFTYSYVPDSSLLAGYTNTLGLSVSYEYEPYRDLKTLVSNAWGTNVISTFAYTYDAIGRRTRRVDDSSTTNLFGYNLRSELVSAEMGTNTYSYAYDPIGNRTETVEDGLTTTYAANSLNQYTALNPASTNPTPFTYDPDGNMTSDGTFLYQYDAAHQLTNVIRSSDSIRVLSCRYDALGRRVEALREDNTVDRYVYFPGSFLVLAVRDAGNTPKEFYTRGLDLSGTLDGAGGIGGILSCSYASAPVLYPFVDVQGNITALASSGGIIESFFKYSPYGTLIMCTEDVLPRILINTKEVDEADVLCFYGVRYYCAWLGRWLTREPFFIQEEEGLYNYFHNDFGNMVDAWGLQTVAGSKPKISRPNYRPIAQPHVDSDELPRFPQAGIWMCQEELVGTKILGVLHHRFLVVDGDARGFEKKDSKGFFGGAGRIRDELEEPIHHDVQCYEMKCLKKDCAQKVFHDAIALAANEQYWLGYQDCQSWANITENWMYDDCADCDNCSQQEIKMSRQPTWKTTGFKAIKAKRRATPEFNFRGLSDSALTEYLSEPVIW